MLSHNLIELARAIAQNPLPDDPHDTHLRRATSSTYYAMFHCLAESCASLIAGAYPDDVSESAWIQAYRALDHSMVPNKSKNRNRQIYDRFSPAIKSFAFTLVDLKAKRESADYNPAQTFAYVEVIADIDKAAAEIDQFEKIPETERRNFAIFLLLPIRHA